MIYREFFKQLMLNVLQGSVEMYCVYRSIVLKSGEEIEHTYRHVCVMCMKYVFSSLKKKKKLNLKGFFFRLKKLLLLITNSECHYSESLSPDWLEHMFKFNNE